MHLEGRVLSAEDVGGEIKLTVQVVESAAPAGTYYRPMTIQLRDVARTRNQIRLGREVVIDLKFK